jgi:calcineurin-like phosphoesterase family protein
MSLVYFCSDLHLGHENVTRFRTEFTSAEAHHIQVLNSIKETLTKRDTLYILGDIAFKESWAIELLKIPMRKLVLVLGNHDLPAMTWATLYNTYGQSEMFEMHGLTSYKGYWLSHCPIHPDEMRKRKGNIHGHTHFHKVSGPLYINACLEYTNYKPILFRELIRENSTPE